MWNDRYSADGLGVRGRAVFDPVTLTVATIGATAASGALSAASTLAGGSAAAEAGRMQQAARNNEALQIEQNASQAFASSQRKMLDTRERTRLMMSTARARAAASGVDPGTGSPLNNTGELAQRGEYHALMDIFNGQSEATGLRNQAAGVRYSGEVARYEGEAKKKAAQLEALGTLAGTVGNMASSYGNFRYPTSARR